MNALASISPVVLSDCARGLAQQMVLWGHDVRHPDGNALVRYGLERRASTGLTGTSCYSMPWENGVVELHGAVASWTAAAGKTGCVFCRDRGRIDLWEAERPPVPGRENGVSGTVADRWKAFQPLLRWLIDYETWVFETLGETWRQNAWRALKKLPKGKVWIPPHLALRWWQLAVETSNPPRPRELLKGE
jgi:hypothetical protein